MNRAFKRWVVRQSACGESGPSMPCGDSPAKNEGRQVAIRFAGGRSQRPFLKLHTRTMSLKGHSQRRDHGYLPDVDVDLSESFPNNGVPDVDVDLSDRFRNPDVSSYPSCANFIHSYDNGAKVVSCNHVSGGLYGKNCSRRDCMCRCAHWGAWPGEFRSCPGWSWNMGSTGRSASARTDNNDC